MAIKVGAEKVLPSMGSLMEIRGYEENISQFLSTAMMSSKRVTDQNAPYSLSRQ